MEAIIKEQVDKCTHNLLKMGQQLCSNIFSENIYYIIRIVDEKEQSVCNFFDVANKRLKCFEAMKLLTTDKLVKEIIKQQSIFSWIDLVLYFSSKIETIIMVECICGKNYSSHLNYHCSIILPPENLETKEIFDVNWYFNWTKNKKSIR
jgi:hypothetical protein